MIARIDMNLIAVLDAILQAQGVSRAAEQIGLSKPAMSHALARLRKQMNDPVLVRAGQGWRLSDRAVAIREQVHQTALAARALLSDDAAFDPAVATRELRVDGSDDVVGHLGHALLDAVAREAPQCALRLSSRCDDAAAALCEGRVDLAIGGFAELPGELRTQALFVDRVACVARRGHPHGRLTLDAYRRAERVVALPAAAWSQLARAVEDEPRRPPSRVPTALVALDAAARSNAVALVPRRLAERFGDALGLATVAADFPLPEYTVSQVWHPRSDADGGHRWLRQLVARVSAPTKGPRHSVEAAPMHA
jgi:DNA-binding transcriptional LysR family regulator